MKIHKLAIVQCFGNECTSLKIRGCLTIGQSLYWFNRLWDSVLSLSQFASYDFWRLIQERNVQPMPMQWTIMDKWNRWTGMDHEILVVKVGCRFCCFPTEWRGYLKKNDNLCKFTHKPRNWSDDHELLNDTNYQPEASGPWICFSSFRNGIPVF